MSVAKQQGKTSTLFSLGVFIEDTLERYKKELYGLEGTKQALLVLVKKFEEYILVIDRELESNEITISEAASAKRHVATCVGIVRELARASESQYYQAQGKVAASDRFVVDIKKMFDEENDVLKTLESEKAKVLKRSSK